MFRPATAPKAGRKRINLAYIVVNWQLYVLLALVMVYYIMFHYMPMYGLRMAFMNFNPLLGFSRSPWVGGENFMRLFRSPYFVSSLINTLAISGYTLLVNTPIPIIFALLLNTMRHERVKRGIQTITYAPHFISTVVIVGMLKLFLSPTSGIVNHAIEAAGGNSISFMTLRGYFRHIYVWSGIWQDTGWNAVIYMAALAGIDPELHEAATVDGAGRLRRIWHIDLPGILPTVIILLILGVGNIMNVGFEKVYLMQNDLNLSVSEIIATYSFKIGLEKAEYSFSAAIGFFNSTVTMVLLLGVNMLSRRLSDTSLW